MRLLRAATPKFEAKRHGASEHSNNCVAVSSGGYSASNFAGAAYERVQALLDIEDAYPLIDETFREGWEAPGMADYDRYDELKQQCR
jgi:hypothetical protein